MEIIPFTGFLFEEKIYFKNEKHINRQKNEKFANDQCYQQINRFAFYILFHI